MNDEEKAKMKKLEEENAKLLKENGEFKDSNTKLGEDLKTRDERITTLEKNAKDQGLNFKKLREMTEAEKELLSEKEKELLQRQEKMEEDLAKRDAENLARDAKVRETTISNLANRFAKGNKDVADQIKINLGKLNPELVKGITEEELTPHIESAFRMTGVMNTSNPLMDAHLRDGLPAKVDGEKDFAESKDGKDLASALGLSQAIPEAGK